MTDDAPTVPPFDLISQPAIVALGSNWWPKESIGSTSFRWACSGAEILIGAIEPVRYTLNFLIEPGPGVGTKPFSLVVLDAGMEISTVQVIGKQNISIELPPTGPKVYRLELRAKGGGATIPHDVRVLDFRVFHLSVETGRRDVLPASMKLGMGWYPLEDHAGSIYRWVNNDAEITLSNKDGRQRLEFDVESGPSQQSGPLELYVLHVDGEKRATLSEHTVEGRAHVNVALPAAENLKLLLHVRNPGTKVATDTRMLNFRLFQYVGV